MPVLTQTEAWKNKHKHSHRWEGFLDLDQAIAPLRPVSFLADTIEDFQGKKPDLTIEYWANNETPVKITAQLVSDCDGNYFMEPFESPRTPAAPAWRDFPDWKTEDVLVPNEIAAPDLGVLITAGPDKLAPALVHFSPHPGPIRQYHLGLCSSNEIKSYDLTIVGSHGYRSATQNRPGVGGRECLQITFPADKIPEGQTTINVTLHYEDSDATRAWSFYHKRRP